VITISCFSANRKYWEKWSLSSLKDVVFVASSRYFPPFAVRLLEDRVGGGQSAGLHVGGVPGEFLAGPQGRDTALVILTPGSRTRKTPGRPSAKRPSGSLDVAMV
jgi:hypothetical protein